MYLCIVLWQIVLAQFILLSSLTTSPLPKPIHILCSEQAPPIQEGAQAWFVDSTPLYGELALLCARLTLNGMTKWSEVNGTIEYTTTSNQPHQSSFSTFEVGPNRFDVQGLIQPDAEPNIPISVTVKLFDYDNMREPYVAYVEYLQPNEPFPGLSRIRNAGSMLRSFLRQFIDPMPLAQNLLFAGITLASPLVVFVGWLILMRQLPSKIELSNAQITKKVCWLLCMALLFASILLLVHFARAGTFPYSATSLEIRYVESRLIINFAIQAFGATVILWQLRRSDQGISMRQLKNSFVLAMLLLLASCFVNMVYVTSNCCENPLATFWGFPFSWLVGIAKDAPFDKFDNWTTLRYVTHFGFSINWRVIPWKLTADLLFWWMIAFSSTMFMVPKNSKDK